MTEKTQSLFRVRLTEATKTHPKGAEILVRPAAMGWVKEPETGACLHLKQCEVWLSRNDVMKLLGDV